MKVRGVCSVDGCEAPHNSHGYCQKHLRRWQRHGDPLAIANTDRLAPAAHRIASFTVVNETTGCIEAVPRIRNRSGYGVIVVQCQRVLLHRLAWEVANGPVPEGLFVLHRCDNPPCCLLAHLFLGTHEDNMADAKAKGRFAAGERHHWARLTANEAGQIKALLREGVGPSAIARRFAVDPATVSAIKSGLTWRAIA